jgi:hypothetical protein
MALGLASGGAASLAAWRKQQRRRGENQKYRNGGSASKGNENRLKMAK